MTAAIRVSDRHLAAGVPSSPQVHDHRLSGAAYRASPNCDERPDPQDLALIVIHNISLPPDRFDSHPEAPERSYIDDLFLNRLDPAADPYFAGIATLRVSAHLCIFRDGRISQYVPFDRRAWHAGVSEWRGRSRCNDFSIGIELEGSDVRPFTEAQYAALTATIKALLRAYPGLRAEAITGHSDIAPGRKTDPGPCFDWPRLRAALGGAA
ncbi:MAG: 1,6-anhydro-N-acetylmuramyl-L-alanine amidase AmpD [Xanthomonadaceae bacterium]|nr:1,6-anhydro-N-acetylmuramyl-L-alanine amidase AmpD [Xanthomonadaceae bacterium]